MDAVLSSVIVASKQSHQHLIKAYEELLLASQQEDVALVFLQVMAMKQSELIPGLIKAFESVEGAANVLLVSRHAEEFIHALNDSSLSSSSSSKEGSLHAILVAFFELLSSTHHRSSLIQLYEQINESTFASLLDLSIASIANQEIGLANQASELAEQLIRTTLTRRESSISLEHSLTKLKLASEVQQRDAVIYLRYLGLCARLASFSEELFDTCVSLGLIDFIVQTCRSSDVLVSIVAMELLNVFARLRIGLSFLMTSGTFSWLVDTVTSTDMILQQQALREVSLILATAAEHHLLDDALFTNMQQMSILPRFMRALYEQFQVVGTDNRITGLRVVTDFVCSSPQALNLVCADGMLMEGWLSLAASSNSDIQAACLYSVGHILAHNFDPVPVASSSGSGSGAEHESSETDEKKRIIADQLAHYRRGQHLVPCLLKYVRQPISTTRCAAISVLAALATTGTRWGMHALISDHELRTYIVTPGTETTKECMEAKYALLLKIHQHPQYGLLGAEVTEEIGRLINRGPFYSPPRVEEPQVMDR